VGLLRREKKAEGKKGEKNWGSKGAKANGKEVTSRGKKPPEASFENAKGKKNRFRRQRMKGGFKENTGGIGNTPSFLFGLLFISKPKNKRT